MRLTSSAFQHGQPVPTENTCAGRDVSPPLAWSDVPAGTAAFGLVMDDPDAPKGTWTHWTFWNLPASVSRLEAAADVSRLGAVLGRTSAGLEGYHGPCPPSGTHRYFFTLYAQDALLPLRRGAGIDGLRTNLQGHAIGKAVLMGTFAKPKAA